MEFCKNCSGMLWPDGSGNLICKSCNYQIKGEIISSEKIQKKEEIGRGLVDESNPFATYQHECEKCGYNKSELGFRDPMYTDEDNLVFLKCGKCGFVRQLARKTR